MIPLLLILTLIFIRLYHIDADFSSFASIEPEEKASGYNARNKVLFGDWDSGGGWYQPMVYMPLANLFSYISFSFFGVGTVQLRLPFTILSILSLILFYIVLNKEYGRRYAIFMTAQFGLVPLVVALNRSAINENLSILYVIIIMLVLQSGGKGVLSLFFLGLLIPAGLLIKIDHIYICLAMLITVIYCFISGADANKRNTAIKGIFIGLLTGLICAGLLFWVTDSYNYLFSFYTNLHRLVQISADYRSINATAIKPLLEHYGFATHYLDNPFISSVSMAIGNIFIAFPKILMAIDPFGFLVFAVCLFLLKGWGRELSPVEIFSRVLLLILVAQLTFSPTIIYYKRLAGVLPVIYLMLASAWKIIDDEKRGVSFSIIFGIVFLVILFVLLEYDMNNPWVAVRSVSIFATPVAIAYFIVLLVTLLLVLVTKRWLRFWLPSLIFVSIIFSAYTVADKILFPKSGHRYFFAELSKHFSENIRDKAVVFSFDEQIYRMIAYESNLKVFFRADWDNKAYLQPNISYITLLTFDGSRKYPYLEKWIKENFPDALPVMEYHMPFSWAFEIGVPIRPAIIKVFRVR